MTKDEQIKGMANPNRGYGGVQEARPALVQWNPKDHYNDGWRDAMNSIAAQPAPVQEPVAWNKNIRDKVDSLLAEAGYQPDSNARHLLGMMNFDTTPPAAQRKPLTEGRLKEIWYATQNIMGWYSFQEIARAVEAAHNIKENNT